MRLLAMLPSCECVMKDVRHFASDAGSIREILHDLLDPSFTDREDLVQCEERLDESPDAV